MNLVTTTLALEAELPKQESVCDYVTAAGGLYVRAHDHRIAALVPVALSAQPLTGLALVEPYARLLVGKVPEPFLRAVLKSARAAMPREAMYQFVYAGVMAKETGGWGCARPAQKGTPGRVTYLDYTVASVDLHSHHAMAPFFSSTDDADEQGLRFYCVIGRLDTDRPQIAARVGVYGHTLRVPATTIFESLGPFFDTYGRCRECGCTEGQACPDGCYWVEEDLCSRCAEKETA